MIVQERLVPIARQTERGQADASAAGIAVVTLGPVPEGYCWRLTNLGVASSSAATSTAAVYAKRSTDNYTDLDLIDLAASLGNRAVSNYASPPIIRGGEFLIIRWTGATAAALCVARAELDVCEPMRIMLPNMLDFTRFAENPEVAAIAALIDP